MDDAAPARPDEVTIPLSRRQEREQKQEQKGLWHYIGLGLSGGLLIAILALVAVVIAIPRIAGATPLTVLTSSMEPGLPPGTLIVVRPVDVDDLAIGDVVTYQIRSGEPAVITHRIIGISASSNEGRTFELQGDNNSDPDPDPVLGDQIRGRVWYSVPLVGFANNAMSGVSREWLVPAAAVLLVGYAGYMIASGSAVAVKKRRARRSGGG